MSFMKKQVYLGFYYRVETGNGNVVIPADVQTWPEPKMMYEALQQYCDAPIDGEPDDFEYVYAEGWLARMSAPGYMDCTDWTAHASEQLANEYLDEMYGDDDE
jgi:hypothetical protein